MLQTQETAQPTINMSNMVKDLGGISVVHVGGTYDNWNSLDYTIGISAETVGAEHFSMDLATFPPGAVAQAHMHVDFEVGVFLLSGELEHRYGPYLEHSVFSGPGELLYIKPGVAHEVYNHSQTEPATMVVVRTSPHQWDEIVTYNAVTNEPASR
jgi:uncharacterized RmlC-like cupin family protein